MLVYDGVNFIDGDMFVYGFGQLIKLLGFIVGIFQGVVQWCQFFVLVQVVEQCLGKGIVVEQVMEIGVECQVVVVYCFVVYCLFCFM